MTVAKHPTPAKVGHYWAKWRVAVPDVRESQGLENFFWGPEVVPLFAEDREARGPGGEARKAHYGPKEQPWDVIVASGWGPAFAASCVLRYLRRDKAREHSVESARWYYARLIEGVAERDDHWDAALVRLELILTKEERALARGETP